MQVSVKHDNVVDCSRQLAVDDSGKEAVPCRPSACKSRTAKRLV